VYVTVKDERLQIRVDPAQKRLLEMIMMRGKKK
jgi:hypothetical protein